MPIWFWILISIVVLVIAAYVVYDLYWLSQPQIFLVYKSTNKFSKVDEDLLAKIKNATGAELATQADLEAEVKNGLNFCTAGIAATPNGYAVGWPTFVDKDFKGPSCLATTPDATCPHGCGDAGCICGCGCNKSFNVRTFDNVPVKGFWLKGNKPARMSGDFSGWEVAPYSQNRYGLGVHIGNKYEFFGIPKLF